MGHVPQKQASGAGFTGPVDLPVTSKEYWHGRFMAAVKRFKSFNEMVDLLAEQDPVWYAKADGFTHLLRIREKRTKVEHMERAVTIMEKLRPGPTPQLMDDIIKRHKIKFD